MQWGVSGFGTPLRHIHEGETYGIVFETPEYAFSYIPDTRFFDALIERYGGALLIINVVRLEEKPSAKAPLSPGGGEDNRCLEAESGQYSITSA